MADFRPDKKQDFDLDIVLDAFQRCLLNDGSLSVDEYLRAFHELCRFFCLTGKLFSFVAKDLESKMKPIEARRKSSIGGHYVTLQSMMQYEMQQGIVGDKGRHPSGTRQFLRLHRALEFILEFMRQLRHSDDHAKTSHIASEVYGCTLSKHHPWVTRQLAALAVHTLPPKKFLIDIMCKHDYHKVHELIDDVTKEGQPIYDVTQKLYADNDLVFIP
ncbi:ceramide-1-phosphate transfer protein-like [Littorina saxatilis]|uniref:Glycolipid transfer protein domain-containing protein n=1 Tax=Littorina saxatilis TaxID=31220 RepID=A0AAN9AVM6_9CAEN